MAILTHISTYTPSFLPANCLPAFHPQHVCTSPQLQVLMLRVFGHSCCCRYHPLTIKDVGMAKKQLIYRTSHGIFKHDNSNFWKNATSQTKKICSLFKLCCPPICFLQFFPHLAPSIWVPMATSGPVGGRCSSCHLGGCLTMHCTPGAADDDACGLPILGAEWERKFHEVALR